MQIQSIQSGYALAQTAAAKPVQPVTEPLEAEPIATAQPEESISFDTFTEALEEHQIQKIDLAFDLSVNGRNIVGTLSHLVQGDVQEYLSVTAKLMSSSNPARSHTAGDAAAQAAYEAQTSAAGAQPSIDIQA